MRHFPVKSLPFGYRNIFAFNGSDGYLLPFITPPSFKKCTIGDRLMIQCLYCEGDAQRGFDLGEIPANYFAVCQYQSELNVTFLNLVRVNL